MLDLWQLIVLAVIQGLTEFIPVSSSAHLILPSRLLGWPDQGPLIDVMAHFGSLFAVLIYFRDDVLGLFEGAAEWLRGGRGANARLALNLAVATPPALLLAALMAATGLDQAVRSAAVIAATTIVFGIALWLADLLGRRTRRLDQLGWRGAALLGLAQALALVPGTSRSGITMTAALSMGFTRVEAARFSMLMSIPVIAAGGLYSLLKLSGSRLDGAGTATLADGLAVAGLSFAAAWLAIALFMRWVPRIGMLPFMLYRLGLGAVLLHLLLL